MVDLSIQPQIIIDILQVAVILVLTYIAVRVFRVVVRRAGGQVPSGLVASLQQIGAWAIWAIGLIIILSQLQVNTSILLLILGLGGLAVIVAYQVVLGDIGAAQFISNYQAFKVGEWIEVEHHYGRVVERNLIHTKLLTVDNEVVVIPNSMLLKNSVVNRTRSGGLRVRVPIMVKAGTDLKLVEDKLLAIGEEMKVDLVPDSSPLVRVAELNSDSARLVLMLHIANPAKRDQVTSDVQRRAYELISGLNSSK
jgi:small conductance mechanosensitive channel